MTVTFRSFSYSTGLNIFMTIPIPESRVMLIIKSRVRLIN